MSHKKEEAKAAEKELTERRKEKGIYTLTLTQLHAQNSVRNAMALMSRRRVEIADHIRQLDEAEVKIKAEKEKIDQELCEQHGIELGDKEIRLSTDLKTFTLEAKDGKPAEPETESPLVRVDGSPIGRKPEITIVRTDDTRGIRSPNA